MKITEDYVSFEIAKLLKEKGFAERCHFFYPNSSSKLIFGDKVNYNNPKFKISHLVSAPTYQMACKWLREEKNLCIYVFPHKDGYEYGKWEAGICYCDNAIDATINACGHIFDETYEEACEAAIKYTLENLI